MRGQSAGEVGAKTRGPDAKQAAQRGETEEFPMPDGVESRKSFGHGPIGLEVADFQAFADYG
jgi:hypothetical protein